MAQTNFFSSAAFLKLLFQLELVVFLLVCLQSRDLGANALRFWTNADKKGKYYVAPRGWADGSCQKLPSEFNDRITYVEFYRGDPRPVTLFVHGDCRWADLWDFRLVNVSKNLESEWNDKISAYACTGDLCDGKFKLESPTLNPAETAEKEAH